MATSSTFLYYSSKFTPLNYQKVISLIVLLNSSFCIAQTSSLPLIEISTNGNISIKDEPKISAHMGIIDQGMNSLSDPYNGYDGSIGIEIRGASSQSFQKKSYSFETRLSSGENNNVSLLGMPKENDWVLHGPYSDKSLLRNSLAYHIGAQTGQYTPRTRLCELYINKDYRGVYLLTEKIKRDENRVDIANLKPEDISGDELSGGYIIQIDRDNKSTDIDGWWTDYSPSKFVAFHDPSYNELQDVQREYIRTYISDFENQMRTPDFTKKYAEYIDEDSWVDYFIVSEIGKHIDAYKLSFYMHKKKSTNGGKLHFGPLWDFNLAFGNFDFVCSPDPEGWSYEWQGTCDNSHPFWIKKLTDYPKVSDKINCRWITLRNGPLHTDSLLQYIDNRLIEMGDAPTRNFEKWDVLGNYVWPNYYVGESYEDEVTYLKNWLTTRLTWMDNNMIGECTVSKVESNPISVYSYTLYPNPCSQYLFVETEIAQEYQRIEITNHLGTLIESFPLSGTVTKLDISSLSTGLYSTRIVNDRQIKGHRMIWVK